MRKILFCVFVLIVCSSCGNDSKNNETQNILERFIAHAGGEIEGHNYTNSLEAIDLSYSKGCRLFEIDIIETSDGKLVSAHDWVHFKQTINYQGEKVGDTPLTEQEVLSAMVYGKYTPMNMEMINDWFEKHSDAIFVTDKINDPDRISDEFKFKDRLIMELFSWEAIKKAIELGITALVSENLIFETENIEKKLDDLKITHIGMPRDRITDNKDLLKRLKAKGIKNYVWYLEKPINGVPAENYVWENEMEYCYGMYANSLDIIESLLTNR